MFAIRLEIKQTYCMNSCTKVSTDTPIQHIMLHFNIIKGLLRLFGGNNVSKMISN